MKAQLFMNVNATKGLEQYGHCVMRLESAAIYTIGQQREPLVGLPPLSPALVFFLCLV
jgi:hypothetical protein